MPAPRGFVQKLDQIWHREGTMPRKGRSLVAVSGGADSVALLRLLMEIGRSDHWHWELVVGHVDHGIRGRESAGDAAFVKGLAKEVGVPFVMKRLKLGRDASEGEAREARFKALTAMARKAGCERIVMGHHMEDHAETVLMKLFRGCGVEGLRGLRGEAAFDGVFITRPLVWVRRGELRAYLKGIGQGWREDETNAEMRYTRNRVRAEVLPAVEKIWPRAVEAIGRMSEVVGEVWGPVHDLSYAVAQAARVSVTARQTVYKKSELQTWPAVVAEIVRRQVERLGGTREIAGWERVREAVRLIQGTEGGKCVEMGRGVVVRVGKEVVIERVRPKRRAKGRAA